MDLRCDRRVTADALTNADAFIEAALEDPIVRLVMRRDGITAVDVVEVIRQARSRVGARPSGWAGS